MAGSYSASCELVEGHGEVIGIADWSENQFGIRRALIDVEDATAKLARFYHDRNLLQERSRRAREFALAYGWAGVVAQWDQLLRSLDETRRRSGRVPGRRARPAESIVQSLLPHTSGASLKVKIVQRQMGHLESSILADRRQHHSSDTYLPALASPCEVAKVRVPRRLGYVGVSPGDAAVFVQLRRIFPILQGWVPAPLGQEPDGVAGLEVLPLTAPEEVRFEVAQSVLLLNVSGELPEELLVDAGLYGVPCIGTRRARAQQILWPELAVEETAQAVVAARALLTNAARVQRLADGGRMACLKVYGPNEEESAASLRRLHAREQAATVALGG